ncbi:hypothetical protein HYU09_00260 [Candidatus Woesearchaeota archaeon]|nr:hypothetical protein [Candidatus Woesearchaeota archaeon]
MYKRHNIWDEDKWDIHKSESKYAGGSGSGYAGHSSKDDPSGYHKNDAYGSKNAGEKLKDDYRSVTNAEEDKDKEKEKDTIAERIAEEEKKEEKQHQEEEEGLFKSIKNEFRPEAMQKEEVKKKSRKQHGSIEEAINKAIKEEKKTVFID